jgi:hypothetical protein
MRKLHLNYCGAFALLASFGSVPANAFDPPFAWTGGMVIVTASGCGSRIVAGDAPALSFRPKLQTTEANSALSYNFGHSAGIIKKTSTALQFKGASSYSGLFISGRAEDAANSGTYSLAVTPATVTSSTNFITLTGSITNFAGRDGCNVTIRGAASRRF